MEESNSTPFERVLWACIYICFIGYTILMVMSLWEQFLIHPTVTTLASSTYPVNKIPFPGISVCSVNRISRKRARSLAIEIANLTKRDPEVIFKDIRFLGQLYDFEFESASVTRLLEFQNLLDNLNLNVLDLIRQLSTPCDELLRTCYWRNVKMNCSSIFLMRRTYHGFCCTFNYVKSTTQFPMRTKPQTTDAGVSNGLYVAIKNSLEDYYYTPFSSTGVMLNIFLASDYPDKHSGGVTEILAQPNSENFIEITPTKVISVPDVSDYPVEKRECLFDYERMTDFNDFYSQSDCNVECRIASIQAMCECIPAVVPFARNSVCTLADVQCLHRYKDKWFSYYPYDDVSSFLDKEKQDSLWCDTKCYSRCEDTLYEALVNSFPIFNKNKEQENITHVYFYYVNRFSNLYRQDVVYYWFEILSNFGGIFGIFVGWSIISIMQLLFYYLNMIWKKLSKTEFQR